MMGKRLLLSAPVLLLSFLLLVVFVTPHIAQAANTVFYLRGNEANPTLGLNAPSGSNAEFARSSSLQYNGGNAWKVIGTWSAAPGVTDGVLTSLDELHVWLGLKDQADQGTKFDLRAEVKKNGTVIATVDTLCIHGIVRDATQAKKVDVTLGSVTPTMFNGTSDVLSLTVSTRIGTNPNGTKCDASNNTADGLRLYFNAENRDSRFNGDLSAPTPTPTNTPTPTPTPTPGVVKAYVTNTSPSSNSVSVIDTANDTVLTTIPVGNEPRGVAYHAGTNRAYVVNSYNTPYTVSVIDTTIDIVVDTIDLGLTQAFHTAMNSSGTRLYLNGWYPSQPELGANLTVIDTTTDTVIATVWGFQTGSGNMTVSPDGTKLYYADQYCCFSPQQNGYVRVVDTATNTITTSIQVDKHPTGIVVTPDGSKVYVANVSGQVISVIDTATNTVVDTISSGQDPMALAINSTGSRVYVTNTHFSTHDSNGTVKVIDTATDTIIATVTVGPVPNYLAVSTDDSKIYVANSGYGGNDSNTVSVIDTATNTVTGNITVGFNPWMVATKPNP